SIAETVQILNGLRERYESYHNVRYEDAALEAAVKLAARHLRDFKLPDSAIDVIDEAGAVARLRRTPDANSDLQTPAGEPETRNLDPGAAKPEPGTTPPTVITAADIEAVVARMARIPARQASASDRERLRTLEESLNRVVFGQADAVHLVAQAIKR